MTQPQTPNDKSLGLRRGALPIVKGSFEDKIKYLVNVSIFKRIYWIIILKSIFHLKNIFFIKKIGIL